MTLDDALLDIHALQQDLQTFERKYGMLSEIFYESYSKGEEPDDDAWVMDWSMWAGTYEIWKRRREQYQAAIQSLRVDSPELVDIIKRTARHEPIPVSA